MRNTKLISVLVILAIALCLSACGKRESPETAMNNALQALKNQDYTTLEAYLNSDSNADLYGDAEKVAEKIEKSEDFENIFLKHLSYKIIKSEEKDDTATVTVEITNADLGSIFSTVFQKVFSELLPYVFQPDDQRPSDEEIQNMYLQCFTEELESEPVATVTKTVPVTMHFVEDHWKIDNSKELADALTGGFASIVDDFSSIGDMQQKSE